MMPILALALVWSPLSLGPGESPSTAIPQFIGSETGKKAAPAKLKLVIAQAKRGKDSAVTVDVRLENVGGTGVRVDPVVMERSLLGFRFLDKRGKTVPIPGEMGVFVPLDPAKAMWLGPGAYLGRKLSFKFKSGHVPVYVNAGTGYPATEEAAKAKVWVGEIRSGRATIK